MESQTDFQQIKEKLRAHAAANTFMLHNHMELSGLSLDHAEIRLTICQDSRNPLGILHGSGLYTMVDNAAGYAAYTDGHTYVTQSSTLNFFRSQAEGTVRAVANVLYRGHMSCAVNVDVFGENDLLLASGSVVYFRVDKAPIADSQKSD